MTNNDKKLLTQMIRAGRFNNEIIGFLQEKQAGDTKEMIKKMGVKYCLHPANAPVKGSYGI